jgi:putative ABC transport system permease protein
LKRNAGGIDVVVGAKGSPLQLILSTIYHTDVPIGNISMEEYEELEKNPMVKSAIPLAMGDNYKGWRIIGTTPDYIKLYNAEISEGRIFQSEFEVLAGSATNVKIGDEFSARHGFSADSDDIHDDEHFHVVGKMAPTGTVIDKLFLTSISGVQDVHKHGHEEDHHDDAHHDHDEHAGQITAILIKARNGAALMNLPRQINQDGHVQAANPAFEMTKLSKNFGVGRDVMNALGASILVLSVLMLFSMLASSLTERRHDMAVLRVLGARPSTLFLTLMVEGVMVAGLGSIIGVSAGHVMAYSLTGLLGSFEGVLTRGDLLSLHPSDIYLVFIGCGAGLLAAFPAALSAARTDIAQLLAKG